MKLLLVFASTLAIVLADAQGGYSGGGAGSPQQFGAFNIGNGGYTGNGNSNNGGYSAAGNGNFNNGGSFNSGGSFNNGGSFGQGRDATQGSQGPQVFRYVSIHAAPEDPEDQASKVIRVPGDANKHVNILFIKSPSNGSDRKTEIVLPEQDTQKNLVYVLVQKSDAAANLKIKRPEPKKPAKPEVYFIRYKNAQQNGEASGIGGAPGTAGGAQGASGYNNGGAAGSGLSSGGAPSAAYGSPSSAYGSPSAAYGSPF